MAGILKRLVIRQIRDPVFSNPELRHSLSRVREFHFYFNRFTLSPTGRGTGEGGEFQIFHTFPVYRAKCSNIRLEGLVKSLKMSSPVIPANPGSGPGQAPGSNLLKGI
jgi:hypothetical protein